MRFGLRLLIGLFALTSMHGAVADEPRTQRIQIEAEAPSNSELQEIYDVLKQRQWLEKIQEIYGVFKLPADITIRATSCNGISNAWYTRGIVTICYEYLDDIRKSMPQATTLQGLTPSDAVIGQFVYTVSHELGHALFDVLDIPILGQPEDAADQFAAYMMLQLDKDQAHRLLAGAAYSYKNYIRNQQVTVPLIAFADEHSAPMQRFYNLLCMAYGADREAFGEAVEKGYLPQQRARGCKTEYGEMNFAFQKLFIPAIDDGLWKQVMSKKWLPDPNILLFRMTGPGLQESATPIPQAATPIPQAATPIPRNADTMSDQK